MLVKIPIYIELEDGFSPDEVDVITEQLQKDFSNALIDFYEGKEVTEGSFDSNVTILTARKAKNAIKRILRGSQ